MEQIVIRAARPEDYPAVEAIMRQVQQLHIDWRPDIYRPVAVVMPPEKFEASAANQLLFVAELDGVVAGVMELLRRHVAVPHMVERKVLFIETMAVDERCRGRGVGHAFFDHLKAIKEAEGLDGIELQVNARNGQAIEMYTHYGFRPKSINMELPG